MKQAQKLTADELKQYWKNAYKTYGRCHGHWKAERNAMLMKHYEEEMKARGIEIPYNETGGQFNGEGSY